ncbi:hypothetical protein GCM10022254_20690 [Actinomadura meridiana]|uniref:Transposase n=1 Tax=Actinomadura meridiana TaxID=559626 RepID=A0ABP8BX08_9ACTN
MVSRGLRHTVLAIMSGRDVLVEEISGLVGCSNSEVTETVYRYWLKPEICDGAERVNDIFKFV